MHNPYFPAGGPQPPSYVSTPAKIIIWIISGCIGLICLDDTYTLAFTMMEKSIADFDKAAIFLIRYGLYPVVFILMYCLLVGLLSWLVMFIKYKVFQRFF